MKTLLAIALLLSSCATVPPKQDDIQINLVKHISKCRCLLNSNEDNSKTNSWQLDWKNKEKLKSQVRYCSCSIEFTTDDVDEPLVYIKPGTEFYQYLRHGKPWEKMDTRLDKVD